jgi:uncharacterized protein YlaN (UPF0358 family)
MFINLCKLEYVIILFLWGDIDLIDILIDLYFDVMSLVSCCLYSFERDAQVVGLFAEGANI